MWKILHIVAFNSHCKCFIDSLFNAIHDLLLNLSNFESYLSSHEAANGKGGRALKGRPAAVRFIFQQIDLSPSLHLFACFEPRALSSLTFTAFHLGYALNLTFVSLRLSHFLSPFPADHFDPRDHPSLAQILLHSLQIVQVRRSYELPRSFKPELFRHSSLCRESDPDRVHALERRILRNLQQ
jgi:hypothetical protein